MKTSTSYLSTLVTALVGAGLVLGVQSFASPSQTMKAPSAAEATGSKMLKAAQDASMKKMMAMPMPMTGDVDRDFSMMMADHHALGITMAEIELKYGKDARVRAMATKIRAVQMKERMQLLSLAKTAK